MQQFQGQNETFRSTPVTHQRDSGQGALRFPDQKICSTYFFWQVLNGSPNAVILTALMWQANQTRAARRIWSMIH